MKDKLQPSRIIWYEVAAFLAIIAFAWANELSGLEGTIFHNVSSPPDWRAPIIQTIFTILVGIPAVLLSRQLSKRLHYLEGFLKICAWCHRVGQGDDWISIEEFVKKTLNTETTHGICPRCMRKMQHEKSSPK